MPTEGPTPSKDTEHTEHTELKARIERYKRLLDYFLDPGALKAIRESIADLEARLKKLE